MYTKLRAVNQLSGKQVKPLREFIYQSILQILFVLFSILLSFALLPSEGYFAKSRFNSAKDCLRDYNDLYVSPFYLQLTVECVQRECPLSVPR